MNLYKICIQELEKKKCKTCGGDGLCNDAEPGDISFNEWTCPDCEGSGLKDTATTSQLQ